MNRLQHQKSTPQVNRAIQKEALEASEQGNKSQLNFSSYKWIGHDEFDKLDDRKDVQPLKFPPIKTYKRVALVRHGQSTWNAAGIIQGSSNIAVLTPKGVAQAETAKEQLDNEQFDCLYASPLARARETAEIIWGNERTQTVMMEPHLREIDLYSFQGLVKEEGKEKYGDLYFKWQKQPSEFIIDNRRPVRELWYRASLVWQKILNQDDHQRILVVAHNAVNQALICVALGLPSTYFRHFVQSNGASSVIDFVPDPSNSSTCKIILNRLNQSPGVPYEITANTSPKKQLTRLVLYAPGRDIEEQNINGNTEGPQLLTELHNMKTAEMLIDLEINHALSATSQEEKLGAETILKFQKLNSIKSQNLQTYQELNYIQADQDDKARQNRIRDFWSMLQKLSEIQASDDDGGNDLFSTKPNKKTILVCAQSEILRSLLSLAIGLNSQDVLGFRMDDGSISIAEFREEMVMGQGALRCMNYTSHLGRWAIPITTDESDLVCGVDGCF